MSFQTGIVKPITSPIVAQLIRQLSGISGGGGVGGGPPPAGTWILSSGFWVDSNTWQDSETWVD